MANPKKYAKRCKPLQNCRYRWKLECLSNSETAKNLADDFSLNEEEKCL